MQNMTNCSNCGAPVDPDRDRCLYCGTPYQTNKKQSLFPLEIECPICRKHFEGTEDNVGWSMELCGPDTLIPLGLNYVCPHCCNRIESVTYLTPGKKMKRTILASDLIGVDATQDVCRGWMA